MVGRSSQYVIVVPVSQDFILPVGCMNFNTLFIETIFRNFGGEDYLLHYTKY